MLVGVAHVLLAVAELDGADESLRVEVGRERCVGAEGFLPELEGLRSRPTPMRPLLDVKAMRPFVSNHMSRS